MHYLIIWTYRYHLIFTCLSMNFLRKKLDKKLTSERKIQRCAQNLQTCNMHHIHGSKFLFSAFLMKTWKSWTSSKNQTQLRTTNIKVPVLFLSIRFLLSFTANISYNSWHDFAKWSYYVHMSWTTCGNV